MSSEPSLPDPAEADSLQQESELAKNRSAPVLGMTLKKLLAAGQRLDSRKEKAAR